MNHIFIDNVLARISSAEDIRQTYFYYFTVSRRNLLSSNYALQGTWENRWPSTVENVPFGKFLLNVEHVHFSFYVDVDFKY